jgi:MFS family permease
LIFFLKDQALSAALSNKKTAGKILTRYMTTTASPQVLKQEEYITRYHWLLFVICFISTAIGGAVSTLMSVYLPVVVKDLLGDKNPDELNNISAYINAVFIFGWALGGFTWGFLGDRIGRKKAILLSIACYGIFTICTGYANSWWGVVLCRVMSGFGMGGVLVTTTTLMVEVWPRRSKAIFVGILSISIPVGIFSAGLINYMVTSWRQGFLIGIIPLFIALISVWILKESSKWREAHLKTVRRQGNAERIFSLSYSGDLLFGSLIFGTMLIGLWAVFSWIPTWIQSLIVITDANEERGLSMMLLGAGGLSGGFLSGWLVNAIGLRKSMLLCFAASTVLSFILFKTNTSFSRVIYAEIGILALFFGASQGVLSVYVPNLFPTSIRATATGFCFNIGRVFTATAVLFVGVLVSGLGGYGNAIFIFSLVFVIGWLVMLLAKRKDNTGKPGIE